MRYFFLFFAIIIMAFSCERRECRIAEHKFVLPVTLTPAKDTFYIEDTIFVASEFHNEVFDKETNQSFVLKDFNFFPRTRIRELSDTISNEAGILDFEILIDTVYDFRPFNYSSGAVSYLGNYKLEMETYSLKYKLIPQKSGLYYFSFFSGVGTKGEDQDFPGKCSGAGIQGHVQMNEGNSNNIDLLSDSPNSHFNEWMLAKPDDRFHKFGGYCFYVKE